MYIVRWLMGHPILATWFLGAIAILLSIGNNSGHKDESHTEDHATKEEMVKPADSTKSIETPSAVTSALIESDQKKAATEKSTKVEEVKAEDVKSVEDVKVDESSVSEAKQALVEKEELVTTSTVDSIEVTSRSYPNGLAEGSQTAEAASKTDVAAAGEMKPVKSANDVEQTKETVETNAKNTGTQADLAVTANQPTETIIETPKPVDGASDSASIQDLGQSSTEEMLLMAREAYWNNGLDEASQIYTQLIELEPTVIEHRGELGNVYWRQGYPEKAAELYSEIAIPMIEQGNSERVANMIGFIGLFYPDRAAEIHKRLQAATH